LFLTTDFWIWSDQGSAPRADEIGLTFSLLARFSFSSTSVMTVSFELADPNVPSTFSHDKTQVAHQRHPKAEDPNTHKSSNSHVHSQLASAWMTRLQILSVVTTFLAGIDAQFLSLSTREPGMSIVTTILSGALIFHLAAAIVSFTSSFILIHYQIADIQNDTIPAVSIQGAKSANAPVENTQFVSIQRINPLKPKRKFRERVVFDTEAPELKLGMPLTLLMRCHCLCIGLSVLGFLLGVVGIMSYIWDTFATPTGIFSSVCVLVSCLGALIAFR
jgi:hypothetical protein